jgi:hypothetical protein
LLKNLILKAGESWPFFKPLYFKVTNSSAEVG